MGTAPVGRLIAKFAIPSVIAMLVMSLYNIVDQLFIGHGVGYLGNAATTVVFPVNIATIAVSMLVGEGAATYYSMRLGEGNRELAKRCVANALVMFTVIGVAMCVVCFVFLPQLLGFFGANDVIMPYAIDYAAPIVFALPFMVIGPGLAALIRSNGSPGYSMKVMLTGAIFNTILDPIFIFSFGMGVKGAAIATAIAQFASLVVALAYFFKKNGFGVEMRHFRLVRNVMSGIVVLGLASCFNQLAITAVIIILNRALTTYGAASIYGAEITLAAHGIVMKVNQILFSVLLGISMGSQPLLGYNFGAKNYGRIKKIFLTAVTINLTVGSLAFIVFFFFPQYIINLFGNENELYNEFARKCFQIFLFCVMLNGFTVLSGTLFQSMGKMVKASIISLSRQILLMIPAASILPLYLGIDGVLFAGPVTDGLSFVLALVLVYREFHHLTAKDQARTIELSMPAEVNRAEPARVSARFSR